ncbi:Hypothetical protein PHPALM_14028 [Phytophthora palmivora]|uniref:Uncharacterized protein n=1 Tax=Phytophthora palmivora TaxID=4796 RepID=A0A2P4XVS7_9STRA|nr:Hypothetical protein PHPALM_14028 [Phytophthora palmivora]
MRHDAFRAAELIGKHVARLETAGSGYRIFPSVHLLKLKPILAIKEYDRVDFDEAILPEDSWVTPLEVGEYEVEQIIDVRSG